MLALIQFDSTSLPLVERMLEEGRLPNLDRLRRTGRWQELTPPSPVFQSATYPSLHTGIEVGEHALYSAFPWSGPDQRVRFVNSFPKPPTIWERLTSEGLSSLVIDPYLCWSPAAIEGVYISGWQFEDRMVMQGRAIPRSEGRRLARRYGRPPGLSDVYGRPKASALVAMRDELVRGPGRTAEAAGDLLGSHDFDLVWINFSSAHKAGHHLWDPKAVIEEGASDEELRILETGLEDVYAAVDTALGRILETLPDGTDLIVFSPIGMGPNTSRADLLPQMLRAVLAEPSQRNGGGEVGTAPLTPVWRLREKIPVSWRARVAQALPDRLVADVTTRLYIRADWTRTRAMAIPGECHGYIRLNLAGREREGIVDPAEAEALMDLLADGLMSFRDPNGSATIEAVERTADHLGSCACAEQLPDLVVRWADRPATGVESLTSARYGEVRRGGIGSGRSGHHNDDAWALLVPGPSRPRDPGRPANLTDIGATACELLGVDRSGLSGRPLLEPAGGGR